jgi:hypothetical protein
VYLGDLSRLQEIQRKRDATNRDWQRIILRNVGKALGWDMDALTNADAGSCKKKTIQGEHDCRAISTRQLWWQIHTKMDSPEYSNMLLLQRMKASLEDLMYERKQMFVTKVTYNDLINKLHLDAEGKVVEPFAALADRKDRVERQRVWYQSLSPDLEEECLIK